MANYLQCKLLTRRLKPMRINFDCPNYSRCSPIHYCSPSLLQTNAQRYEESFYLAYSYSTQLLSPSPFHLKKRELLLTLLQLQMGHHKDLGCTYILWFFFGVFGVHRFYLGIPCIFLKLQTCILHQHHRKACQRTCVFVYFWSFWHWMAVCTMLTPFIYTSLLITSLLANHM